MRLYVAAIAVLPLAVGCVGSGGKSIDDIRNKEWRAVEINGSPVVSTPRPASMLLAEQGQASGSGSCNRWFAPYQLEGEAVSFGQIGSTRILCEGPVGAQERVYFDILKSVDRYSLGTGGTLTLATPQGQTITFRR